jgi:hypothetical protein
VNHQDLKSWIYSRQHFFGGSVGVTGNPMKASKPTLLNRDSCSNVTDEGIIIFTKPLSTNAFFLMRNNLDLHLNVNEESDSHSEKHSSPKTLTNAGRMISIKPVPQNVPAKSGDNLDPDSNVTEESNLHPQKQLSPKISTVYRLFREEFHFTSPSCGGY